MKIKLATPPKPIQYEPITLTLETEAEFIAIRAALARYSNLAQYNNTTRARARSLYHRMNDYAAGTTIESEEHLLQDVILGTNR